ncbi:MAG: perosamine synthetase [Myxococcota bacterium]|jgi:perosamine synthetase
MRDLFGAATATPPQKRAVMAAFEDAFTRRFGVRSAVPTGSGRLGLRLILKGLGIGPGAEVIVPAFTDESVPEAIIKAGATPVFVDVSLQTFNLDPDQVEAAIVPQTRAIVATHIFGAPCDMSSMLRFAQQYDLDIIEDCAHAIDSAWQGRACGSLGTAAIFSFVVTKAVNAFGGGMVATCSDTVDSAVRSAVSELPLPDSLALLRRIMVGYALHHATKPDAFGLLGVPLLKGLSSDAVGLYNRLVRPGTVNANRDTAFSPVQAAAALSQLRSLDETQAARRIAAERIIASMPAGLRPQVTLEGDRHSWYFLVALADDPDAVVAHCLRRGVDVGRNPMRNVGRGSATSSGSSRFPNAQAVYERGIQIPIHPTLNIDAVDRVVDAVGSFRG